MIHKTIHNKLKFEQHEHHENPGWARVFRKGTQFFLY